MSAPKFTPGPWKCAMHFGEWFVRQDPLDWNGMGYQFICGLPADKKGTHYGDMFKANAHLIAAAPDLFHALWSARSWVAATKGQDANRDAALAVFDSALSKAIPHSLSATQPQAADSPVAYSPLLQGTPS